MKFCIGDLVNINKETQTSQRFGTVIGRVKNDNGLQYVVAEGQEALGKPGPNPPVIRRYQSCDLELRNAA